MPTSATTSIATAPATTSRQCVSARSSHGSYRAFSQRVRRGSSPAAIVFEFGSSHEHSTGVTVSATTSEAVSATTYAKPERPQQPAFDAAEQEQRQEHERDDDRRKHDRMPNLGARVVDDVERRPARSAAGSFAFSRSRRTTFSTSMIASSTSSPIAIASPPRLMLLMREAEPISATTAASSESGSASSVIAAARTFIRNTTTTRMTRPAPSSSAVNRLWSDCSMKSALRNRSR